MPKTAGVGFTDVGSGSPGTDSSQFKASDFAAWRPPFYARLAAQARRAGAAAGCTCGACAAPPLVAFSGKTQFAQLFLEGPGGGGGRRKSAWAAGGEEPPAAAAAPSGSSGGEGSSQARLPVLQARRPAAIGTGLQWVLPDGWPLPLSTEVCGCWG